MRTEAKTSMHLLMACIVSIFSAVLVLITLSMSWEAWTVPLIFLGCFIVWWLHIGRVGSEIFYENICAGLMLGEFFFLGVHESTLFDIPAVTCVLSLIFSLMNRKRLLYITAAFYIGQLLYHFLYFHTISYSMDVQDKMRLGLGTVTAAGAMAIARYWIKKEKEEALLYDNMLAQLDAAERHNADFLSNVSHELRTPINMVIGISELALEKENVSEIHNDIYSIQMAGKRLSSQINNILDYTEIVEGTLTAAQENYRITSVVNDVLTMTALQNSRKHLEMVFDIDPGMPSILVGDAEKISHILKILLENSIKFTEEGGINVCMGFRRESYGANLIIDIYDTGIGMTASQLTQMFADFYQADSGSRRYTGGLGLGLSIANGLLHSIGGFVHFESKEQQGLQVHIIIPQGIEDDTPSMVVSNAEEICMACYFRPEKYKSDEVRKYYDNMILHLVEGLGIEGYEAHNFEGLKKLQREHNLTHIFIAQSEYEENRTYYEEMALASQVTVIAEKEFTLPQDSRLLVIRKPFFALPIVNLLNGQIVENGFEKSQITGRRPFSCVGIRALAVDDEEMNLVVAKGVLGSYGIQVDTCLSGRAAIKRCSQSSYDVIFLDHMMPGFDGVETLRRIREMNNGIYQDLPIIALTANTMSGAREMFKNEGFTEFVPKPIERSLLERVLLKVLPTHCISYSGSAKFEETPPEDLTFTNDVPQSADLPKENFSHWDALTQAGIDVELGLDYCSGETDFYLEMLRMFHEQAADKKAEITALYASANWKDYAVKVHALKSTSLTIGAQQLSECAKALEQAGKRSDTEYIQKNHPVLLAMYDKICSSIAGIEP